MGRRNPQYRRVKKRDQTAHQQARHVHVPDDGTPQQHARAQQQGQEQQEPSLRELVEAACGSVLYSSEDGYHLALDQAASLLSEPSARWPETGRAVLLVSGAQLARLWRAGWQPADLARAVRRELTTRHLRLAVDLMAAELRGYAAAGLDPRWTGQLRELEAAEWWGQDDAFLPGVSDRERLDRFSVATLLLELYRLIGRLPPLTLLGPPPGAAPRTNGAALPFTPKTGSEPRMLGRIRALLAKAESTEFPDEAEALTAKAQQLMAQHSIDEALLAASSGSRAEPGACRIGVDNPYEAPKALLLDAVAGANRATSLWTKELGFCTVVGFPADLEAVELLYTSLLVQATGAMNSAGIQGGGAGGSRTKGFRQSFLISYAARIRERLSGATAQATEEALVGLRAEGREDSSGLLPVLAAREEAVRRSTEQMFPNARAGRAIRASDYEGWTQGRAAADRAQLRGHGAELPR
ncbi:MULTISPECIES: DUF2786 domain-containing protein [Streptacidiphilus]|uniref:DUF2786 domain-containing protein n=1 Tax=Streptacidiphilus cavernicola TaxID=3342716 RepID=A0ABV6UGD5_9ACTN|nr:DUF2786 domain-containing protein [Streptacidiphilus jeojiense]